MNLTEELKKHIEENFSCDKIIKRKVHKKGDYLFFEKDPLFSFSEVNDIYIVSIGKSGYTMFKSFQDIIKPKEWLVINPSLEIKDENILKSTHPEITSRSFQCGKKIVEFLRTPKNNDLVVFLISGGASSLVEYSIFPPEIISEINRELLNSNLNINKINQIRQSVSSLKKGGMLNFTVSNTLSFIISDIPGGMFENVGSGPTVPICKDDMFYNKCQEIVKKIPIKEEFKKKIFNFYNRRKKLTCNNKETKVIKLFQPREMIPEVNAFFKKKGFDVSGNIIDFNSNLKELVQLCKNKMPKLKERELIIVNGEVLYKLNGSGSGGRVTHFCLNALEFMSKGDFVGGLATDGVDGITPEPISGVFYKKENNEKEVPDKRFKFDSYSYFLFKESLIKGGYSGINLCDIYFFGKT